MSLKEPDIDMFFALETSLHRPEIRASRQVVSDLIADEFIEFGKSGRVYNKQITVEALAGKTAQASASLPYVSDFSVRRRRMMSRGERPSDFDPGRAAAVSFPATICFSDGGTSACKGEGSFGCGK